MARMNRPAPVEITYKNMRFLITHNPTNATLHKFIEVSVCLNMAKEKNYTVAFLKVQMQSVVTLYNYKCKNHLCFINPTHQELKKYGVTTVVRVCEATYDANLVVKEGIQVLVSAIHVNS